MAFDNTPRKSERQLNPKGTVPLPFIPSAAYSCPVFGSSSLNWFKEANVFKLILRETEGRANYTTIQPMKQLTAGVMNSRVKQQ